MLKALSSELLDELEQAVTVASPDKFAEVFEKIGIENAGLAFDLERLADGFEYKKILAMIRETKGEE